MKSEEGGWDSSCLDSRHGGVFSNRSLILDVFKCVLFFRRWLVEGKVKVPNSKVYDDVVQTKQTYSIVITYSSTLLPLLETLTIAPISSLFEQPECKDLGRSPDV